jgi:RNA polymerase sigma factor (sigma-70 family)
LIFAGKSSNKTPCWIAKGNVATLSELQGCAMEEAEFNEGLVDARRAAYRHVSSDFDVHDRHELGEDLSQEAVLQAIRMGAQHFPARGPLVRWVSTAAHHLAITEMRKRRRRNERVLDSEPPQTHRLSEREQQLRECVEKLPPGQREIMTLRLDCHTWTDIGKRLHLTRNQVNSRKEKAMNNLQRCLSLSGQDPVGRPPY